MGHPPKSIDHPFTYADYLSWPDAERWELIDGRAYEWNPVGLGILGTAPKLLRI